MMAPESSLTPFFSPRGVAVIGASNDPTKLGYGLARNLVQSNYQGVVHFVNPKGGSLLGRPLIPRIADIPNPVDLAILLIPARSVAQAVQECGERGIKAVIIGSGGFRETGPAGAALEEECLQRARACGVRLMGPNCIGLLDTHLPMDATFLPPPGPLPGDVAFISHSGAICAAVIDWARGQGFGLSRLVSLGNQVDVNETDVLEPVAADPFTRVLTLYLEGVSDGRRFVAEAGRITRVKPVIALKVGRFRSGQRAVASHTGALAGQESAFNAAFRRAGVIRAENSEEMFDWARALAWCPPPKGRNVAILTNAGGPGVTAADALEANRLQLAELQAGTMAALQGLLPPAASLLNPVDMLASASPEQYAGALRLLLLDPGVHSALVILPPPPMFTAGAVAKALIPVIHNAMKPVVIALMGERLIQEAVEHFRAARVPEYRFPERAASALAVLAQRAEYLKRVGGQDTILTEVGQDAILPYRVGEGQDTILPYKESGGQDAGEAGASPLPEKGSGQDTILPYQIQEIFQAQGEGDVLPQEATNKLMQAYGIPVAAVELATSAEEAAVIASRMGFPVVLKVASPDIPHKSDTGGVMLNLENEQTVAKGFATILERTRAARPTARLLGVHVQPMISTGQEVIVGALQDLQFGPLVMFGSGGVEVEGLKDVAFALAPLSQQEAGTLLDSTWAGQKLRGYRNLPPADRQAVLEVLLRVGQLAADLPQLAEIEINPLRVLPEGEGAIAIDVRIVKG